MARVRMNRMDPETAFLSNKVKGDVEVWTPDGIQTGDTENLGAYAAMQNNPQPGSAIPEPRVYGGRSGIGKQLKVE